MQRNVPHTTFSGCPTSYEKVCQLARLFAFMKITVQLFARARDLAGADHVELDLPATARVADLKRSLAEQCPRVSPLVPNLLVAIGTDYADDRTVLTQGIPQSRAFLRVSGG